MKQTLLFNLIFGSLLLMLSCQPVSQITSGEDAYQYKRFPQAIELLKDEIESTKAADIKAKKSFWMGESYRLMNRDEESIKWYRQAYEYSKNRISLESYARAVHRAQQYTNAKKLYLKLISDFGTSEAWDTAVKSCEAASFWMSNQDPNQYVILRSTHNSQQSDFSPTFYEDVLVFASDREESVGDSYHWTGNQLTDFYRDKVNEKLDQLLFKINTPANESNIAFSSTLDRAVFTRCGGGNEDELYEHCHLEESVWDEAQERWSTNKRLDFCKQDIEYGHPTFFDDDQAIIFSSDDPNGLGGQDLWVSYKKDAIWQTPIHLPKGINSIGNEKFPSMQDDRLYFSSDGKVGMGGLDIFYAHWIPPNGWKPPVNMKPPINSGGDDFGYVQDPNFVPNPTTRDRFFISSNRKGSQLDDLYIFEEKVLGPVDTVEEKTTFTIVVEGRVFERLYETPGDPNSRKMGTRPLGHSEVHIIDHEDLPRMKTAEDGFFKYEIETDGEYRFSAAKADFLSHTQYLKISLTEEEKKSGTKTYIVNLILEPITYDIEIVLSDIFYDFNKWNIRPDAEPSLLDLHDLLRDNPTIKIELASHTDCRGLEIFNTELSQRRAQSAVDYLVGAGIQRGRLLPIGYGKSRLRISCICTACTEEEHQANRRTSFRILKNSE